MNAFNNYPLVNNIILFSKGEFSQWYGGFKGQTSDFTLALDETAEILGIDQELLPPFAPTFNCAEQAMMWGKAVLTGDNNTAAKVLQENSPAKQKALGRTVSNFDATRWDAVKLRWVTFVNYNKFNQNEDLAQLLVSSHPYILCEAAPWDKIWGNGLAADHPDAANVNTWNGLNLLGTALMFTRQALIMETLMSTP